MLVSHQGCLVTARTSCIVKVRYANDAAGLSGHGAVVMFSRDTVRSCRDWAVSSRLGCLVRSRHASLMPQLGLSRIITFIKISTLVIMITVTGTKVIHDILNVRQE